MNDIFFYFGKLMYFLGYQQGMAEGFTRGREFANACWESEVKQIMNKNAG